MCEKRKIVWKHKKRKGYKSKVKVRQISDGNIGEEQNSDEWI